MIDLGIFAILRGQKWVVDEQWIRNELGQCPLCALARAVDETLDQNIAFTALRAAGITDICKVINAADFYSAEYRKELIANLT